MQIENLDASADPAQDLNKNLARLDSTITGLERGVEEQVRLMKQGGGSQNALSLLLSDLMGARREMAALPRGGSGAGPAPALTGALDLRKLEEFLRPPAAPKAAQPPTAIAPPPPLPATALHTAPGTGRLSLPVVQAPTATGQAPATLPATTLHTGPTPATLPATTLHTGPAPASLPATTLHTTPGQAPTTLHLPTTTQRRSPGSHAPAMPTQMAPAPGPPPLPRPANAPSSNAAPGPTMGEVRTDAYKAASEAMADARRARLTADFYSAPGGQAVLGRQARAQLQQQTAEAQQGSLVAQAGARAAATPEGKQQIADKIRADLMRQESEALRGQVEAQVRAGVEQERLIGLYGRTGVALLQFGSGLTGTLGAIKQTADSLQGTFFRLAGAASPSHLATFTGSLELLAAKMGRSLLPLLDRLSSMLQGAGDALDSFEKRTGVGVGATLLGGYAGYRLSGALGARLAPAAAAVPAGTGLAASVAQGGVLATGARASRLGGVARGVGLTAGLALGADVVTSRQTASSGTLKGAGAGALTGASIGAVVPIIGPAIGGLIGAITGGIAGFFKGKADEAGEKPDLKRSYRGLPQGGPTSIEAYSERLQMVASNHDPLQAELLREQLRNLQSMNDSLRSILGHQVSGVSNMSWAQWGR